MMDDDPKDDRFQDKVTEAVAFSQKLQDASLAIVGIADGTLGKKPRDPEIVALTILCRSISNFHAVLVLVHHQGVVEARALVRLIYENVLWIGALQERGSDFVADMLADEAHNRKTLAELTFNLSAKSGEDSSTGKALQLRTLLKEMDKHFPSKRRLNAAKVAACGPVEMAYFESGRFSLDAVHCSVTALGRHISSRMIDGRRELMVAVVPNTPPREVLSTIVSACRALIFALVGVVTILDLDGQRAAVEAILSEFDAAAWVDSSDGGRDR